MEQDNDNMTFDGLYETTFLCETAENLSVGDAAIKEALIKLDGQAINERYRLLKVIGKGGMGVVYEALDEAEQHLVAIKILSSDAIANDTAIKRFYREAKTGMALAHANIVKTHHYGEFGDGMIFIVMEYISGGSLKEYIANHAPLAPLAALPIVEQLCQALDFAHRKGVLHRDLKPANVLKCEDERGAVKIKLADFGIAKLLEPNQEITNGTDLTGTGVILGTLNYIAPEYLIGQELTLVSDLYSLGVIVYQLLTGKAPITAASLEQMLHSKVYRDLDAPSRIHDFLPAALDPILLKILDRNPANRYQSALDFQRDFSAAVSSLG